jgi:hypothetical protein
MKLDILAIGVHPDDVELSCSGTLLKHISQGKICGVLDLTCGELGTRGSGELRLVEAQDAAKVLGVSVRDNLKMADGFFRNDEAHQLAIIKKIREYQPEIILCNAVSDQSSRPWTSSTVGIRSLFLQWITKSRNHCGWQASSCMATKSRVSLHSRSSIKTRFCG